MKRDEAIRRWLAGEPAHELSPRLEDYLRAEYQRLKRCVNETLADIKQAADTLDDAAMERLDSQGGTEFETVSTAYEGTGLAIGADALGHLHNRLVMRIMRD